ncbi:35010_t:CDS:1, partial [Gigaspora margarita]
NDSTSDRWKYLDIIPRNESYYYINGELLKFNEKIDFFNSLYGYTMYGARTWAKEK